MITGLCAVSACSQTGDFGRVRVDPTYSYAVTQTSADERQAHFALTDDERRMNARIYRFLSMDHTDPWLHRAFLADVGVVQGELDETAYFAWMKSEGFASSHGPYNRLENDIRLDLLSLPQTFESVCKVQEIDRRRDIAAGNLVNIEPLTQAATQERLSENRARFTQFSVALEFRYDAYVYALEHLLIETPHEEARTVDALLSEMAVANRAAAAGDFCTQSRTYAQDPNPALGAI